MRTTFLAMLIAGAPPAAQATVTPTEAELRDVCSGDPGGEAGMHDCLDARAKASAVTLREAEAAMRAALPKVDEWPRFVAEARQRFEQSTRAFVRYRAIQCAFNTALAGGAAGNSHEFMRLACIAELNLQQAARLQAQVDAIKETR